MRTWYTWLRSDCGAAASSPSSSRTSGSFTLLPRGAALERISGSVREGTKPASTRSLPATATIVRL